MDQVKKDTPREPQVSVHQGRTEGSPVGASALEQSTGQSVESVIEYGPEFAPQASVPDDLARAGVTSQSPEPVISKTPGVSQSIPAGPVYNTSFASQKEAEEVVDKGSINDARTWSAAEALKNFARNLLFGPRQKPSEA